MRALVTVATEMTGRGDETTVRALERHFEAAFDWNGGNYYKDRRGVEEAFIKIVLNCSIVIAWTLLLRERGQEKTAVNIERRREATK